MPRIVDSERYDDKYDYATDSTGTTYWVNKESETVHEADGSLSAVIFNDGLGDRRVDVEYSLFGGKK